MRIETVVTTTVTYPNGQQRTLTDRTFHSAGDNPRHTGQEIRDALDKSRDLHAQAWDKVGAL